jgi:hypothetical protein
MTRRIIGLQEQGPIPDALALTPAIFYGMRRRYEIQP